MTRLCLGLIAVCSVLPAQQLQVKSATAHKIELTWSGSGSGWIVERLGRENKFEKLADAAATSFTDDKLDPFATYQLRVRTGENGTPSNVVTVGPPPAGVLKGAAAPMGAEGTRYGMNSALAFDENGDPALAWLWFDPNGDGDSSDTALYFVHWDRAKYQWRTPVKVATVGNLNSGNVEPVSLAFDGETGNAALVYPVEAHDGLTIAVSKDAGATWQPSAFVAGLRGTVSATSLVIAKGRLYLAGNSESAGVRYIAADFPSDSSGWKSQAAPVLSGTKYISNTNVSLTLDGSGMPLMAYVLQPEDGNNYHFVVWRPGEASAVQAADSNNQAPDAPNLSLAIGGNRIGLLFGAPRDPKNSDASTWFTSSANGTTWSAPVSLPVDGPRSANPPLGLAVDSHGRLAAVFGSNSGTDSLKCNFPAVSRSTDGARWTTCGLGLALKDDFAAQPNTVHAAFAGNDKLYVVWHQAGDSKSGKGLLLWHER
ncbi:MAG TPA: fibronectin type III domain-containing protein [Bryobacteraceae bacterium]|jgi:hypothetical protein